MSNKGYLPHSVIKGLVFWVLTVCILASTLAGILRSWGSIGEEFANNCLWTAFILAVGSIAFLLINCAFGNLGQRLFENDSPTPNFDPAFRERLKAAKVNPPRDGPT